MARLTDRAFEILQTEVDKCAAADTVAGEVYRRMVIKRLEKLRSQNGTFASIEEIRDTFKNEFPNFSEQALKAAVKANRPPGLFGKIIFAGSLLGGAAGIIWLINLPFPLIRCARGENNADIVAAEFYEYGSQLPAGDRPCGTIRSTGE